MLSYVPNHSKHSKTRKMIKSRWIASIWRLNDQKCWVTFKPFQTQQNYKSDQITMNCIDLTSKRSKMLSYVPNHSKHSKTTKVIKSRWIATIWRQNDKNVELRWNHSKHSKTRKVIKLRWIASIWRLNDQKCWVRIKLFQTQQNYKKCIDLTS